MRDDLDGAPQIVAAAFLLNHRQTDLAGGPVAVARGHHARKPLIVTEIQVGLGAVVGDVYLAMLVRAHRAGVDVDMGRTSAVIRDTRGPRAAGRSRPPALYRDETTPPVTKMYFTGRPSGRVIVRASCARTDGDEPPDAFKIFGVSTSTDSCRVSTVRIRNPCSSARNCSSDSAFSSGVLGQRRQRQQKAAGRHTARYA